MPTDVVIQPGDLSRPIKLVHRTLTANAQGEQLATWDQTSAYSTEFAAKADARGQKRFAARGFVHEQLTEFTVRWRSDIAASDHLFTLEDGNEYEILQTAEIGRRQGLDLMCRMIVR